jgi:hypothetical protein
VRDSERVVASLRLDRLTSVLPVAREDILLALCSLLAAVSFISYRGRTSAPKLVSVQCMAG